VQIFKFFAEGGRRAPAKKQNRERKRRERKKEGKRKGGVSGGFQHIPPEREDRALADSHHPKKKE
jgi:hypothetical protein